MILGVAWNCVYVSYIELACIESFDGMLLCPVSVDKPSPECEREDCESYAEDADGP